MRRRRLLLPLSGLLRLRLLVLRWMLLLQPGAVPASATCHPRTRRRRGHRPAPVSAAALPPVALACASVRALPSPGVGSDHLNVVVASVTCRAGRPRRPARHPEQHLATAPSNRRVGRPTLIRLTRQQIVSVRLAQRLAPLCQQRCIWVSKN